MDLRGSVLGTHWKVQDFLGEGACAKVYSVHSLNNHIDYNLVAKVIPLPIGNPKSKPYKEQQRICNTLYFEYTLYTGLLSTCQFCPKRPPKFYGEDTSHGVRYLVMEKMDKDLVALSNEANIALYKLGDIGLQLLEGLRWFHQKNFLFIDVKPDNFMLKGDKLHFVDCKCIFNNIFRMFTFLCIIYWF
jgi:serine/threonine protein kinase